MNYERIYEKLGYAFYAIAASDGIVRREEIRALREALDYSWLNFEDSRDQFGTDSAQYILFSFEYLLSSGASAADAYAIFEEYYVEHESAFNKTFKRKIISTAHAVADAFRGENLAERRILARLENLLHEGKVNEEQRMLL